MTNFKGLINEVVDISILSGHSPKHHSGKGMRVRCSNCKELLFVKVRKEKTCKVSHGVLNQCGTHRPVGTDWPREWNVEEANILILKYGFLKKRCILSFDYLLARYASEGESDEPV